jgi:hypothetical protein
LALSERQFFDAVNMTDNLDDIEGVALELIERFGAEAAHVARDQAEIAASVSDAKAWRNVADAIERLLRKP